MICYDLMCEDVLRESPYGIVANVLDCDIVVSDFELQLRHCINFRTNNLKKGMYSLMSLAVC